MKKQINKKEARTVSKAIRAEFDMLQASLLLELNTRRERALRALEKKLDEKHKKALITARKGIRDACAELRFHIKESCIGMRNYHTEDAIEHQFGLRAVNGIVKK